MSEEKPRNDLSSIRETIARLEKEQSEKPFVVRENLVPAIKCMLSDLEASLSSSIITVENLSEWSKGWNARTKEILGIKETTSQ